MKELRDKIQDLKEQSNNKDSVIKILQDSKENSNKATELQADLKRKNNKIEELEEKIKLMLVSHESIVKILQDDYKAVLNANNNFAQNAKENSNKIAELESVLERKDRMCLKFTEDVNTLKSHNSMLELNVSNLGQTINKLNEKYNRLQDTLTFVIEQWKNSIQ